MNRAVIVPHFYISFCKQAGYEKWSRNNLVIVKIPCGLEKREAFADIVSHCLALRQSQNFRIQSYWLSSQTGTRTMNMDRVGSS
jgi:hypothetical protein